MAADGDDNLRDRRTPRPPNPEDLERIRNARVEPEPLEPMVGTPREAPSEDTDDGRPGDEPSQPSGG